MVGVSDHSRRARSPRRLWQRLGFRLWLWLRLRLHVHHTRGSVVVTALRGFANRFFTAASCPARQCAAVWFVRAACSIRVWSSPAGRVSWWAVVAAATPLECVRRVPALWMACCRHPTGPTRLITADLAFLCVIALSQPTKACRVSWSRWSRFRLWFRFRRRRFWRRIYDARRAEVVAAPLCVPDVRLTADVFPTG